MILLLPIGIENFNSVGSAHLSQVLQVTGQAAATPGIVHRGFGFFLTHSQFLILCIPLVISCKVNVESTHGVEEGAVDNDVGANDVVEDGVVDGAVDGEIDGEIDGDVDNDLGVNDGDCVAEGVSPVGQFPQV